MIMSTLYDTGYNLTNLVELLKIERKISALFGVMSIWTAPYWQTKFGTPYIVFN